MSICNKDNPIFWNTDNELILMGELLKDASTQPIDDKMYDTLLEVKRRLDLLVSKFEYTV